MVVATVTRVCREPCSYTNGFVNSNSDKTKISEPDDELDGYNAGYEEGEIFAEAAHSLSVEP